MTGVPSAGPSSTMTTSRSVKVCLAMDSSNAPMCRSALRNGTTTLSAGTGHAPPGLVAWSPRPPCSWRHGPYQTTGFISSEEEQFATVEVNVAANVRKRAEPAAERAAAGQAGLVLEQRLRDPEIIRVGDLQVPLAPGHHGDRHFGQVAQHDPAVVSGSQVGEGRIGLREFVRAADHLEPETLRCLAAAQPVPPWHRRHDMMLQIG